MIYLAMIWAFILFAPSAIRAQTEPPTLVLPDCSGTITSPGAQVCVSVHLEGRGASIASVGFTLKYDTASLTLPNGANDVMSGAVLTGGQSKSAVVNEDPNTGMGTVQVAITPPVQLPPLPTIEDGELCKICFTVPGDAPQECTMLSFLAADMGSDLGQNIPTDPPGNGGVNIEPPCLDNPQNCLDHYQCYKAKPTKGSARFESRDVFLMDQFETRISTVQKPVAICNPAEKNGEIILDPDTHLKSYQTTDAKVCSDNNNPCRSNRDCSAGAKCQSLKHVKQTNVQVTNQFGTLFVDTVSPDRLLIPTAKALDVPIDPPNPDTHNVDHYRCYKVKVNKRLCEADPQVKCKTDADCAAQGLTGACNLGFTKLVATVGDQFTDPPQLFEIAKPIRLCNPVDKNSEGMKNPDGHLMCYQARLVKKICTAQAPLNALGACLKEEDCGGVKRQTNLCLPQLKHEKVLGFYTNNQFGPEQLDTVKEEELCVPSTKTLP